MSDQKNNINMIESFVKATNSLFHTFLITEISRARQIMGLKPFTNEELKMLDSLSNEKLKEEAALAASTVMLWQNNEIAAATYRMIEEEETKRRKRLPEDTFLQ